MECDYADFDLDLEVCLPSDSESDCNVNFKDHFFVENDPQPVTMVEIAREKNGVKKFELQNTERAHINQKLMILIGRKRVFRGKMKELAVEFNVDIYTYNSQNMV